MTLPSSSKQAGDIGHVEDHNAIVDEIVYVKDNYFSASSSNINLPDYLRQDSASTLYLPTSSSNNFLLISASSNFLQVSASSNFVPLNINTVTSTSAIYRLQLTDAGKLLEMNNSESNTILIPLNASVAFPIGTKIDILQVGVGPTTASIDAGVTLNSDTNKRMINTQWSAATLIKRGTDTWVMIGAIKA